jgi:hypothetical protein
MNPIILSIIFGRLSYATKKHFHFINNGLYTFSSFIGNTNSLIRQYIPKGKDIYDLSDEDIAEIIEKINKRPRKCLGFKTPNQLFTGLNQHVALTS